jgi:hypothetical protein
MGPVGSGEFSTRIEGFSRLTSAWKFVSSGFSRCGMLVRNVRSRVSVREGVAGRQSGRTVGSGAALNLLATEDGSDLDESFRVIVRVKEGESTSEEAEEDDAG